MNLDVNKEVFDIWKKFSGDENKVYKENFDKLVSKKNNEKLIDPLNKLCPITYKKSEYTKPKDVRYDHRFLFAGFNPSFNEKHYKKCFKNNGKKIKQPYGFFKYDKDKSKDENIVNVDYSLRNKLEDSDPLSINYYSTYFDKLEKFIEEQVFEGKKSIKFHHVHIDPFFIRGTNQKQAKKILGIGNKNKKMSAFADEQLNLFEEMIKNYDPTLIIILNATASHILSNRWNSSPDENDIKTSFDFLRAKVICGGMLFGAGGMDNYSKKRFVDEIRRHIKKL